MSDDHGLQVLHALVDLRAVARGNGMEVRTYPTRPEARAPMRVRISVMSRVGGISAELCRGGDAVDLIRSLMRSLEQSGVTARQYEPAQGDT